MPLFYRRDHRRFSLLALRAIVVFSFVAAPALGWGRVCYIQRGAPRANGMVNLTLNAVTQDQGKPCLDTYFLESAQTSQLIDQLKKEDLQKQSDNNSPAGLMFTFANTGQVPSEIVGFCRLPLSSGQSVSGIMSRRYSYGRNERCDDGRRTLLSPIGSDDQGKDRLRRDCLKAFVNKNIFPPKRTTTNAALVIQARQDDAQNSEAKLANLVTSAGLCTKVVLSIATSDLGVKAAIDNMREAYRARDTSAAPAPAARPAATQQ